MGKRKKGAAVIDDRTHAPQIQVEKFTKAFADRHWEDQEVKDTLIKKAIVVLNDSLDGVRVKEGTRKAAQFLAGRLAYPETVRTSSVTIALRGEDVLKARIKAGIITKQHLLEHKSHERGD